MRKKKGTRRSCIESGVGARFTWTELTVLTSLYLLDDGLVIDLHRNGLMMGRTSDLCVAGWFGQRRTG